MIINKIQIINFGVFYGENTIDLRPKENGKNIILIGGKNGSGKTTLLECIKLVIYGPRAYGIKQESKQYFSVIKEKFNRLALREGKTKAAVKIEFDIFEEGIINTYSILRDWNIIGNLREKVIIVKNNIILNKQEVINAENYFSKFMPKNLFDFFFFDGEKIKDLIYSDDFEEEMRKPILSLFNLDVYDNLNMDLKSYLKQDNIFMSLSFEEQNFEQFKKIKEEKVKVIENINKQIHEVKIKLEKNCDEINNIQKEYYEQGGNYITQIEKLQNRIYKLEVEKKQKEEEIKKIIAELLPFIIMKKEVEKLSLHIDKEDRTEIYEKIKNLNLIDKIDDDFTSQFEDKELVKTIIYKINETYINSLKPEVEIKMIHDLSSEERYLVKKLFAEVQRFKYSIIDETYKKINKNNTTIYDIKENIKKSKNNLELNNLQEKLNLLHKETTIYEQNLYKLNNDLDEENKKLVVIERELSKSREQVYQAKIDNNKGIVVNKIQNVLEKYIIRESNIKTEKLGVYFLEMFNKLMRKENFISKIECIPDNFEFKMFNEYGDIIDKKIFSEGEKQIYILSLLWAYIKVSGREIPLVFDTLLGRLDKNHRNNIVEKFLPSSAKQTIILSTDSEIDRDTYKLLSKNIAQEYVFNYLESEEKVSIENGYFFREVTNDFQD